MKPDLERTRVLNELNLAAEEAARIERALTEAHRVPGRAAERRHRQRRNAADRRIADRRSGSGE